MRDVLFDDASRGAVISSCGTFRYSLWRRWGDGPRALFVMLNPSTADAMQDDPTIRRCVGFAKRWRHASIEVVNLFAFRTTDPRNLDAAWRGGVDVIGPDNREHMTAACKRANTIVAAWGAFDARGALFVARATLRHFAPVWCLGRTKSGQPRHPLYVKGDADLECYLGDDTAHAGAREGDDG